MKLLHDWQDVLKRAWSIRLILLTGFFSGMEAALPVLGGMESVPRGLFALLSFISANGAFVTRVMQQKEKP